MPAYEFYPEVEPFAVHQIAVSPRHTLYVEEVGNPQGLPVVFLHGGPGAGIQPKYRRFFDPEKFHVVLFAQRGTPPSAPVGELAENDTNSLVADIETIRQQLHIERWIVFGGSWGSTLALAYAIAHPQPVLGLVLRGIFLGRQRELDWLYREGGASRIFPEGWRKFVEFIPLEERGDLIAAYERRLFGTDEALKLAAAVNWNDWEGGILTLLPRDPGPAVPEEQTLASARIECHYMYKKLFLPTEDYLLRQAHTLNPIPCTIVQGRYDMVCPAESAFDLAAELPQAVLHIVPDAGHSASEPGMTSALIESMLDLHARLSH